MEAAKRSGSLITARLAAEQNREVFAVPGHPLDPRAQGTLSLLTKGATLCADASDVLDVIRPMLSEPLLPDSMLSEPGLFEGAPVAFDAATPANLHSGDAQCETTPDARQRILGALNTTPVTIDELARDTGLPIANVRGAILELDLSGEIERHGLQAISRRTT